MKPAEYVKRIQDLLVRAGEPARAEQQAAYMRHQFDYCGLGAPQWMALVKSFYATHGMYTGKPLKAFVLLCFDQDYREVHYAGLTMMERMLKLQDRDWIRVLEQCITTRSWWDSVDWLAKLTGIHILRFPELQERYAYAWINGSNMWLQRVAIIHQLSYKENTNEVLLFELIQRSAESREFFIQKACGWALRQYARTRPEEVLAFLRHQPVSKLTYREAVKHLKG